MQTLAEDVFKLYNHPHQWQLTLHNPSDKGLTLSVEKCK